MLKVDSDFACNYVVLISSTPEDEYGVPRRIAEHLDTLSNSSNDFGFQHCEVSSVHELDALLEKFREHAEQGMRPILHLDMHGDQRKGLRIEPNKEMFSWPKLVTALRKINVATNGDLVVILSACFGLYAIMPIQICEATPFLVLLAPEKDVKVSEIDDGFDPFYTALFETKSLDNARLKLSDTFKYFHAEKMFVISFAKYIKRVCKGKGGRERKEQLLTDTLKQPNVANTRFNRRRIRKKIKEHINPDQALFDKYAKSFLVGKR